MDAWFWAFLIVGGLALIVVMGAWASRAAGTVTRAQATGVTVVLVGIVGVLFFLTLFTVVPVKTVGVETQFGRPGAVLDNGWHWKAPTAAVHKFDASLQSDHYSTDKDDAGPPVTVRMFTGALAQLNVTFQWRLSDNANFVQVFVNYREPAKIRTNLVKRTLQQALNDQFATYNPYAALVAAQAAGGAPGSVQVSGTYDQLGQQALARLRAELAPQGVQAVALTIASVTFDTKTQSNLDGLSTAIAQTQIARQNEQTAAAQATANAALNGSAASPATVTQLCLQVTADALKEGHTLPAGWSCFGSATAVVPAGK